MRSNRSIRRATTAPGPHQRAAHAHHEQSWTHTQSSPGITTLHGHRDVRHQAGCSGTFISPRCHTLISAVAAMRGRPSAWRAHRADAPRQPADAAPMRHDIGDRLPVYRESHRHPGLDRIDHLTCAISQIPHTHLHVRQRGTVTFPSPSPPRLTVRPYWRASAMRIACSGSTRWPAAAAASAIASCTPLIRPLNALLPGA